MVVSVRQVVSVPKLLTPQDPIGMMHPNSHQYLHLLASSTWAYPQRTTQPAAEPQTPCLTLLSGLILGRCCFLLCYQEQEVLDRRESEARHQQARLLMMPFCRPLEQSDRLSQPS